MGVGRPAWGRPPGPGSHRNSFVFILWFSGVLLISFCCTLDEKSEQGCGWHTSVHQPLKRGKKQSNFLFYSIQIKVLLKLQNIEIKNWKGKIQHLNLKLI
jgi:hypothetical protein